MWSLTWSFFFCPCGWLSVWDFHGKRNVYSAVFSVLGACKVIVSTDNSWSNNAGVALSVYYESSPSAIFETTTLLVKLSLLFQIQRLRRLQALWLWNTFGAKLSLPRRWYVSVLAHIALSLGTVDPVLPSPQAPTSMLYVRVVMLPL